MKVTLTKKEMKVLAPEIIKIANKMPEKVFGYSRKKVKKYLTRLITDKIDADPSLGRERIAITASKKKVFIDIPEELVEHYTYFCNCAYSTVLYDMVDEMGVGTHRDLAVMLLSIILCESITGGLNQKYDKISEVIMNWRDDPSYYNELAEKIIADQQPQPLMKDPIIEETDEVVDTEDNEDDEWIGRLHLTCDPYDERVLNLEIGVVFMDRALQFGHQMIEAYGEMCDDIVHSANENYDCCRFYDGFDPINGVRSDTATLNDDPEQYPALIATFSGYCAPISDEIRSSLNDLAKYIGDSVKSGMNAEWEKLKPWGCVSSAVEEEKEDKEEIVRTPITGLRKPIILSEAEPTTKEDESTEPEEAAEPIERVPITLPVDYLTEEEVMAAIDKKIAAEVDNEKKEVEKYRICTNASLKVTRHPYLKNEITFSLKEHGHVESKEDSEEVIARTGYGWVEFHVDMMKVPMQVETEVLVKLISDAANDALKNGTLTYRKLSVTKVGKLEYNMGKYEEGSLTTVSVLYNFKTEEITNAEAMALYEKFGKFLLRSVSKEITNALNQMTIGKYDHITSNLGLDQELLPVSKRSMASAFMVEIKIDHATKLDRVPSIEDSDKFRRFFIDRLRKVKTEYNRLESPFYKFPFLSNYKIGNTKFSVSSEEDGESTVTLSFPIIFQKSTERAYPSNHETLLSQYLQITMSDLESEVNKQFKFAE